MRRELLSPQHELLCIYLTQTSKIGDEDVDQETPAEESHTSTLPSGHDFSLRESLQRFEGRALRTTASFHFGAG